jgi:hypothetical protein
LTSATGTCLRDAISSLRLSSSFSTTSLRA